MFKLRFDLDLYAGIRPVRLFQGVLSPLRDVGAGIDYVVVRENVEGLYASRDGGCTVQDQVTVDSLVVTRSGTDRIVEAAFRLAERRSGRPSDGRRVVTCVDKSNVLRSYAFFRRIFGHSCKVFAKIICEKEILFQQKQISLNIEETKCDGSVAQRLKSKRHLYTPSGNRGQKTDVR